MSKAYIPQALRRLVEQRAKHRCGYCLTQESVIGMPLVPDHIIPEVLGGETNEDNLWLACRRCNDYKSARISAIDPVSRKEVGLFNPVVQQWRDHFAWSTDGLYVEGLTPIGRATVDALRLNNPHIVRSRRRWIAVGWHPPQD